MFTGFTPETIDFLWGIRMNNNRDWFLEHKKQYVSTLYEPMKALGKDLFAPFMEIPGTILKVSRIYRDARLHHPDPYKESLWLCIRQDVEWWAENPCLFFEINPEGVSYGFTLWAPPHGGDGGIPEVYFRLSRRISPTDFPDRGGGRTTRHGAAVQAPQRDGQSRSCALLCVEGRH